MNILIYQPLHLHKPLLIIVHLLCLDAIPNLIGMVINFPQDLLAKELGALMVNLGWNARNNELFIANKGRVAY